MHCWACDLRWFLGIRIKLMSKLLRGFCQVKFRMLEIIVALCLLFLYALDVNVLNWELFFTLKLTSFLVRLSKMWRSFILKSSHLNSYGFRLKLEFCPNSDSLDLGRRHATLTQQEQKMTQLSPSEWVDLWLTVSQSLGVGGSARPSPEQHVNTAGDQPAPPASCVNQLQGWWKCQLVSSAGRFLQNQFVRPPDWQGSQVTLSERWI